MSESKKRAVFSKYRNYAKIYEKGIYLYSEISYNICVRIIIRSVIS